MSQLSDCWIDFIFDRIDRLNLTKYGAAQIIAAETDEAIKTVHDRLSRLEQRTSVNFGKILEIVIALGGEVIVSGEGDSQSITVRWKD